MAFKEVDTRVSFPALEREIAAWWRAHGIVAQALEAGDRSRPFVFFEGPPTANGRPGVHHIEARAVKDIVIRYQRMRGRHVLGARGGWDTHGLPVEIEVEKELGFRGKPDIEAYGIAEFNRACRESVWRYIQDWERMTDRIAFWIDLSRPYATCDNSYIESLWWILKTFWEQGLLFRDYKVTMHCPRCGTSLSDHEVSLGFEDDVDDPSVWVRFRHLPSGHPLDARLSGAAFLAWTTTPWTLPANAGLAVKPGAAYALVEYGGDAGGAPERLVLAEVLATAVLGEGRFRVLDVLPGDALGGVHYAPLFDGVLAPGEPPAALDRRTVVVDDFVSLEDGTGIVHIAPAYGDLSIGKKHGLPTLLSVDLAGVVLPEFDALGFGGTFFKDADPLITRHLRERGLLFRSERIRHSYPFCWRCHTPLLFYAKPSWYIRTTARKDRLLAHNERIHWVPEHIRHGRFGNWLENNVDWALSRERYWGTPLPIWICDACGAVDVVGSVAELEDRARRSLGDLDLHRPYVDAVTWRCTTCARGTARRVPDVADCWFDSGSMPVAQWHYPFENRDVFAQAGQADYISEAIDQTRGWFYTLHAVSTLLFDRPAFRNVICLGHILDIRGEKMSKSRGNVVDPWDLIEAYGADATRWYMYASGPPYNPRRFAPEHVGEVVRQFVLTLWNTYAFFVTYATLDGWQPAAGAWREAPAGGLPPIDRWVLARLHALTRDVTGMLEAYDVHGPARAVEAFVEELSNWYVRRNRRRFWKAEDDADKQAAYATLYACLTTLSRMLAPFMPHVAEALYQNLVADQDPAAPRSVHLAPWPAADPARIDEQLLADMAVLLETCSLGRAARRAVGIKVRQPLPALWVRPRTAADAEALRRFEAELREELNVKHVRYLDSSAGFVAHRFKPNLRVVGRKYGRLVPALTRALQELAGERAQAVARAVEAGQPVALLVEGREVRLEPGELLVEASSPPGYAVAEDRGLLVALDTALTPELRDEGFARELVRHIQDARKSAAFHIADRIRVYLAPESGASDLARVVGRWGEYLRGETLADELVLAAPPAHAHVERLEEDGHRITIGILRR
jgi:isoleucyl-tRNA synthetase